ncbi:MAG TPA: biotin/lipoyl-containing protein [Gemmatimonadales bacterium]|nr:biotin/lipoyl-containing protein [Gemmatimonadales bacterium]
MKYFVEVGGRQATVEADGDRIVVDGVSCHASFHGLSGTPLGLLTVDGQPRVLVVKALGKGRWLVEWAGERREVEVLDERTRYIRTLAGGSGRREGGGLLKAPMPGLVVRLEVAPGETVPPGGGVLVLEAMKMENELRSPLGGRVRAVLVQPGQAVEKGQALVEFDVAPEEPAAR